MGMATNLELHVSVKDDPQSNLVTSGEVYKVRGANPTVDLVVTHVIVSQFQNNRFALDAGSYEYRFHVERSGGQFTLKLMNRDKNNEKVASDDFDTALGFEHKALEFEVK
jgi:hypothetical protein